MYFHAVILASQHLQYTKEIVKEYSGSALVSSPKLRSSTNTTDSNYKSTLTKTYDSTLDKNYESTYSRDSPGRSRNYENVPHRSYDAPVSKINNSSSTYDSVKNKYSNYESSVVNRSTVYDSSVTTNKKSSSTYDSVSPPKLNSTPKKVTLYDASPPLSPSRLVSRRSRSPEGLTNSHHRTSALDSSYNSSFNSTYDSSFNTSTSTVINTAVSNKSTTSVFTKSPSPARLSS